MIDYRAFAREARRQAQVAREFAASARTPHATIAYSRAADAHDRAAARADRLNVEQVTAELARRHPDQDWNVNQPCPDCGSMAHFEC